MATKSARQSTPTPSATKPAVTKAEAYRLYQVLGQMKGVVAEPRHLFALVRLRKALQPEAESLEELSKPSAGIQAFEAKRHEACRVHASLDEAGEPQISPDKNYLIDPAKRSDFEARMRALQAEHQADFTRHQETLTKINALAGEASEIQELPGIPLSALSAGLTLDQMEALFPILVDDQRPSQA